ncbi:MAG: Hsp20/alpha crystallin family protein [candidate division KSB1 bacterium]|nr:Hsp20/alpha crystallin family protein [candidate division KSB1 bacterium]
MNLTKYNRNWPSYPRLFDRFFDDFLRETEDSMVWTPRMDVKENKNSYTVMTDLPGLEKKDIDVSIQDNVLTVKGERRQVETNKDENSHFEERYYGTFQRSVTLPGKVDDKKVKAEYTEGVLKLTLPKAEEAKSKQIEIQ